jgi:hypothetical protein
MPAREDSGSATIESLLEATRDLLVRLGRLLDFDVPGEAEGARAASSCAVAVPAHLSFTGVPAMLSEAWDLVQRSVGGDVADRIQLADWFGRVDLLSAAIETLHAAGALPVDVVHACRSSAAEGQVLAHGWAAWARAASPEHGEHGPE